METTSSIGKLNARRRTMTGKEHAAKLRASGMIPAICYGQKKESMALELDPVALKKALDPGKRKNTLIELQVTDGDQSESFSVMLKDYQVHPIKRTVLHADFVRVAADEIVEVAVPLMLDGKPEGVKLGGNLHQVFRTLPVRCTPGRIPESLRLDVSPLNIGDALRVKDLAAMETDIKVALPENQTLALVMAPRKVQEETPAAAGAAEGAEGAAAAGAAAPEAKSEEKK